MPLLTIIKGRAGTGKTSHILREIKRRGAEGETNILMIVPEQYSHDAERQLCEVCGDRLSLFAEVLTFSRLSSRALFEAGASPPKHIDKSGQILVLYRAIESVAEELGVFGAKWLRTDLLEKLLETVIEMKSSGMTSEQLKSMAESSSAQLGDKLRDLALILNAYDTHLHARGSDSEDTLSFLADRIKQGAIGNACHIYFDGFNDFTGGERRVIGELLDKGLSITVCLTCDDNDNEAFILPKDTETKLKELAEECKAEVRYENIKSVAAPRAPELTFLEKHLFAYDDAEYTADCNAITIYAAPTQYAECEQAAAKVLQLVHSGYRWRDIAVMARNWEAYAGICESVFERYGVRYFSSGRENIIDKPPAALIEAALDIAVSGWEYKPVFRYIKSGLTGVTPDECAELENYVIKWGIRGSQWTRDWTLPPDIGDKRSASSTSSANNKNNTGNERNADGASSENKAKSTDNTSSANSASNADDAVLERLSQLNALREKIAQPLIRLSEGIKHNSEVKEKLKVVYTFLEEIDLPSRLAEKAERLELRGESRLAGEYEQIWDIIINALEQMLSILEDSKLGAAEFRKLFVLTMSHYSVSVIPVSLDRTAMGGMAMSRRRDLKCLIILGATDENMPMQSKPAGALNDNEREQLSKLSKSISSGFIERYNKEMNMIYSTVTLPSQELIISYSTQGDGRPSFIIDRIKAIFAIDAAVLNEDEYMSQAEKPCLELAVQYGNTENSGLAALAARRYYTALSHESAEYLRITDTLLREGRGSLSPETVAMLYGSKPILSPTRVDNFYSCAYRHFLQSGLRLQPRDPKGFDAPTAGTFIHRILERVCSEIKATVGYKDADDELTQKLIRQNTEEYISEELHGFEGKDARFVYLFNRMESNTATIVQDLLSELRDSDFEPYGFEIPFRDIASSSSKVGGDIASGETAITGEVVIAGEAAATGTTAIAGEAGKAEESAPSEEPAITGYIDRVDVWRNNGKNYIRVIDYKTGKKSFQLSDVFYGKDMQMLIYLFALQRLAKPGEELIPAGVLYFPARDVIINTARNTTEEEVNKLRDKELRRKGLVLSDLAVIEAMENSENKKYLPLGINKNGEYTGDSLMGSSELMLLSRHVERKLSEAMQGILTGDISCEPSGSARENACTYCRFHSVCGFDEELGDRWRYHRSMKAAEFWNAIGAGE